MMQPPTAPSGSLAIGSPVLGGVIDVALQARTANVTSAGKVRRYGARIGAFRFLLAEGLSTELLAMQLTARLPLSPQELLGVINVRGTLVPLFDLALLPPAGESDISLRHDDSETRLTLLVRLGSDAFAIVVDGFPHTLVDLQPGSSDVTPDVPAVLIPYVGAVWHGNGADWYELNLTAFLEERATTQAPRHAAARVF